MNQKKIKLSVMLLFIGIFAHAQQATTSSGGGRDASNTLVVNQTVGGLIITKQSLFYSSIFEKHA